ncbi:MAG: lysophospholipid acyltransferase family protein [Acidobacteriia bacterium]|nr:lysophospholipid acyltransferase family protein [Terriglobia bacterium]
MDTPAPVAAPPDEEDAPRFTLRQRLSLWLVTWAGYLAIQLIGPTLRVTVSIEDGGPPEFFIRPAVYAFWHRCVFMATWWYRKREVAVMTSRSFDGEYIARIISKFGYRPVRGSSSRGAVAALIGMRKELDEGRTAAFTIDGPRGPKYVAKPGPVLLAQKSGLPIATVHFAPERAWVLQSWDEFIIPKPFSRVLLRVGNLIRVPPDADEAAQQRYHAEMQATLDRIRIYAEEHVSALRS